MIGESDALILTINLFGTIFYDIATGSRVGPERALFIDLDHADALAMCNLANASALFLPHSYHYVSTILSLCLTIMA